MIKVLLVENESEKKRLILAALSEVDGFSLELVDYCVDARSAKRHLRTTKYDLVILDINIPLALNERDVVGGGLDVLRFIRTNLQAIRPNYIVGLTAYEDGFAAAQQEFSSPLWKLVRFSYGSDDWREPLKNAVAYLIEQNRPPYVSDGRTYHFDVGVVVGLEEELAALRKIGDWEVCNVAHDPSTYYRARIPVGESYVDFVAVAAPRMGMPAAAVAATKLILTFRPRFLGVIGICAGVRSRAFLGDVVVADPIFDSGSGKWIKNGETGALEFRPAPYPWRLDEFLRAKLAAFSADGLVMKEIYEAYSDQKPSDIPTVRIDAAASGGSVLQASELVDAVREQHKNLVGIEMESYAVFTAAECSSDPRPTCFSMKAVCDFGDDEKSDDFHDYAAYVSASFFMRFALSQLDFER